MTNGNPASTPNSFIAFHKTGHNIFFVRMTTVFAHFIHLSQIKTNDMYHLFGMSQNYLSICLLNPGPQNLIGFQIGPPFKNTTQCKHVCF